MRWQDISIKNKIMIIGLTVIISFSFIMFFYFIPSVDNAIYETKKEKLKDIVDSSAFTIEAMYRDSKAKNETDDIIHANIKEYVSRVRYGSTGKDYLWLNDFQPVMILHPYRQDLNGKNLTDYKDPNGKQLFLEMVKICREKESGYVSYMWQYKDDTKKIIPKISYVKHIQGLDWIIGTGLYEQDVKEEIKLRIQSLEIRLAAVFICITILLIIFVYIVSQRIKQNIIRCVDVVETLAEGDLVSRVNIDQKDEIGKLASALNKSMNDVSKLISSIITGSQSLVQSIEEVSSGNQDLSLRTSQQASSLEEIAATVEETYASTQQNAVNAGEAHKLAENSAQLAVEGGLVIEKAIFSIGEINNSSKKIFEIITMINEIAFQTNLLALNAAVEAARAGDQGRGFAVVAGEVRNLAQRSAGAAKEISALIKDSISKIDEGTALVNKSGDALKDIIIAAKKVKDVVSAIASASEEQSRGIDQINTAVIEMDTMTQQNAALVEQTAATSEEMSLQAQNFSGMVEVFKL